jgi:type II secretory ATPase GspE/PulE/Tfp pilus assembly ATPase PilB-like protein
VSADLRAAAAGPLAGRLSPAYLEEHCVIPLSVDGAGVLSIAAGRALDPTVTDELSRLFGGAVQVIDAPSAEIRAALLATPRAGEGLDSRPESDSADVADLREMANQAPVVQFVNVMLLDALRAGASDVHVESTADGARVRMRLDGVLRDVSTLGRQWQSGAISRIKLLAGLDIAERRLPQDGRSRVRLADRDVDLRVSTLPGLHGESVVLRLLDHGARPRTLDELGMPADMHAALAECLRHPHGLVLATGPTGSGKTTTLYAALQLLNRPGVKVVTVEDPVEYQVAGITQIPVNRKAGIHFANALRAILRHDPDVIMVGEMRDRETADTAIQAALTGHLVLSTLHTNDAAGGITRLRDMGVEPYLVAATVRGIVAQRLVRLLCRDCAVPYEPSAAERRQLPPAALLSPGGSAFLRAVGCDRCAQTGYRGRTGVYELLLPTEEMRARLVAGGSLDEIRRLARDSGMTPLGEAAWMLAAGGVTTIDEVMRVTGGEGDAA